MNIASAHLDALKALGYTESEARFLYIVATHSGYFVHASFSPSPTPLGQAHDPLLEKLQTKRHARTECFKSGTVYHLFSGVSTARSTARIFATAANTKSTHQRRIAMLDSFC